MGLLLQLDSIPDFQRPPLGSGVAAPTGTRDRRRPTAPSICIDSKVEEHGLFGLNISILTWYLEEALPWVGFAERLSQYAWAH